MRTDGVLRVLALLAALVPAASVRAAPVRPEACPPRRYVAHGGVSLVVGVGSPAVRVLTLDGRHASVEGACEARLVRRRPTRKGTVLTAKWRRCGTRRGVVLHAVVPRGTACEVIEGTFRARGMAPARFRGVRSQCGDGFIDPGYGERCEVSTQCAADLVCLACDCASPVVTPTSTTTTTTFVPRSSSVCGNGVRESGEACDGADLGGFVCPEGGTAGCNEDCVTVDLRGCFRCGNGRREGTEECDQVDFGDVLCDAPGETGGELTCTTGAAPGVSACRIDRVTCWRCGNGRIDPGEQCDAGVANGMHGIGCSTECVTRCGDGLLQTNEDCDDGNVSDDDGCSRFCRLENGYAGGSDGDTGDTDGCMLGWAVWGVTPGPTNTCADGAACDRDGAANGACVFRGGVCANEGQSPDVGPVACRPTDLAGAMLAPSATLDAAQRDAVLSALSRLLGGDGASVSRDGSTLTVVPPYEGSGRCDQFDLAVTAGATAVVAVSGTASGGLVDADRLDFVCTP